MLLSLHRKILPAWWAVLLLALCGASAGHADEILVRFESEGAHAVQDCAEAQHRRAAAMAEISADRSDSLDRLQRELRVRSVRAAFRSAGARALSERRAAWRSRANRKRPPGERRAKRDRVGRPQRDRADSSQRDHADSSQRDHANSSQRDRIDLAHVYRLELAPGVRAEEAARRFAEDPHVRWAQPNLQVDLDQLPNDPFLSSRGSWGQDYDDLWGLHRVGAPEAWQQTEGEGVIVAVVDTGLDLAHPDLAANVWVNAGEDLDGDGIAEDADRNGIDDDGNGYIDDLQGFDFANSVDANEDGDFDDPEDVSDADPFDDGGHGSHVAGTIAAVSNNGIGIAGMAPRVQLMPLKGFGSGPATIEVLGRAMLYAIDNGARVINNSWSCTRRCPSNPLAEEIVAFAAEAGVVVVTSAGNAGQDIVYFSPENRRETITVGAIDPSDARARFSNSGYLLDVVAPGAGPANGPVLVSERGILSTRSSGASEAADGGGLFRVAEDFLRFRGTSMSAPHVSGLVALLLSQRPELSVDEIRAVLRASAEDLGAPGADLEFGHGLIDAPRALVTPAPSVQAKWRSPGPGEILRQGDGPVRIEFLVEGAPASVTLSVGGGVDPDRFETIPVFREAAAQGSESFAADWDVAPLGQGAYLLRLEVAAHDGGRVTEYLPLSLERHTPTRLSTPGANALEPTLWGRRVVFRSERPLDPENDDEEPPELGSDLFQVEWRRDADAIAASEVRIVTAPGDQRGAVLSGRQLVWIDEQAQGEALQTCRVHGRAAAASRCEAIDLSPRGSLVRDPQVWGRRIVWLQKDAARPETLAGCVFQGAACAAIALPGSGARQSDPMLSGRRLSWSEWGSGFPDVFTCTDPQRGRCLPQPVELPQLFHVASFGRLFVRSSGGSGSQGGFSVACSLRKDGSCPPFLVPAGPPDGQVEIWERRLVWSEVGPGGDRDIYSCEVDLLTERCPRQRLSGSAAEQREPDVWGSRVVWEDNRDGAFAVFGLELPELLPLRNRRVHVGARVSIPLRARVPTGAQASFAVEFADGSTLAEHGASLRVSPRGRARFAWRPGAEDVGEHIVTFEVHTDGGLVSRRSIAIEVEARRERGWRARSWRD